MQLIENNDTADWSAFREGDDEALMRLHQRHLPALYAYGYNLARDRPLVEDAIQDVFLYLHQHRHTLGMVHYLRAYLLQSVRHRVLHLLKTDQLTQPLTPTHSFLIDSDTEPSWVQDEANAERSRRLRRLVNQLPKRQREALYLIYFQQLDYPQAATIMQVDVKSVYNFVYKALTSLRQTTAAADLLLILLHLLLAQLTEKFFS